MTRTSLLRAAAAVAALAMIASTGAFAAKPVPVIAWSNGFPSGAHFNLNIHGKDASFACDPSSDGGSVFVPLQGDSQINYVENKRSSVTNLTVRDACASFDGDPALIQLPAGQYQVYARILAKPQKEGEPASVVFYPKLVEACNNSTLANFSDQVSCNDSFLMGTGIVTAGGVFDLDSQTLVRDSGRSKGVDITPLFTWSGYACDQRFDTNGDGQITLADVTTDLNGDGVIDAADLALYLQANCVRFDSAWVFDIADLVVYGWDYHNAGARLVQVRFYPLATTVFG